LDFHLIKIPFWGDSRTEVPCPFCSYYLYLESFYVGSVSGTDRLTRDQLDNYSGTGAGAKFDEYYLGYFHPRTRDAENHPLTKAGLEAGTEENDIRDAGRLYGHYQSPRDGAERLELFCLAVHRSEKQSSQNGSDPLDHEGG